MAAAVALIAMTLGAVTPAQAEIRQTFGQTGGLGNCTGFHPEYPPSKPQEDFPCDKWQLEIPPNDLDWEFDDQVGGEHTTSTGIAMNATFDQQASIRTTLDDKGELEQLRVVIHQDALAENGSQGQGQLQYQVQFTTTAPTLSARGTVHTEASGTARYETNAPNNLVAARGLTQVNVSTACAKPDGTTDPNGVLHQMVEAGAEAPVTGNADKAVDWTIETGAGTCQIVISVSSNAVVGFPSNGKTATAKADVEVTISLAQGPCDFGGLVKDGDIVDGHDNPLPGALVRLWPGTVDHEKLPAKSTNADATGRYCFRDVDAGDYELEALTTDQDFVEVRMHTYGGAIPAVTRKVTSGDRGTETLDLVFTGGGDVPLADAANVFWQARRYLFALWDAHFIKDDEAQLLSIYLDTDKQRNQWDVAGGGILLTGPNSRYAARENATTNCPENCEWHELTHAIAHEIGIAPFGPGCEGGTAHNGWLNPTTCGSLAEAIAAFLPTHISLTLDEGRGAGYATPDFWTFNLEDNGFRPWSGANKAPGRQHEDIAVAQLLWDLVDDTDIELGTITVIDPANPTTPIPYSPADEYFMAAVDLVRLMSDGNIITVGGLHDELVKSPFVAAAFKEPKHDANGDGTPDISQLDDVFLLHGFHPVADLAAPAYVLGDAIGFTDRPNRTTGTPEGRGDIDTEPGAAILLSNGTASTQTFSIDVAYPQAKSHFEMTLPAGSAAPLALDLPAYFAGIPASGELPACGDGATHVIRITVAGGGVAEPRTLDSCEYLHAVAEAANGEAAITFGTPVAPGSNPGPSGGPASPAADSGMNPALIGVAVVVVVVVALGAFLLSRRRSDSARTP